MTRKRARAGTGANARASGASSAPDVAATDERPWLRWALPLGIAVVTLGVVLAAFNPAPHTGGDNAGYVTLAYSLLKNHAYTELFDPARLPHTKYPPVFPGVLAVLMLLGVRAWAGLKSVAVASTVAVAVLTYLWAHRRLGSLAAAGVALAVALSSAMVYYSHWVLSDPLFLAFTLLSLWALERADGAGAPAEVEVSDGPLGAARDRSGSGWLALGVAAAGLAYFTRSAGLPLLVALAAWLALRRRWRALALSAVGLGVPVLLWWLRSRAVAHTGYGSEFWLVDPYNPELGRVGLAGLASRFGANLVGYVGTHVPGGITGTRGVATSVLGVALFAGALLGWIRSLRARIGPSEIFLPLYAGLILLWPVVWSGDRFALPLFPLLFGYAAFAIVGTGGRLGRGTAALVGALAFLMVVLPALKSWTAAVGEASACAAAVRADGPFACYGPRVESFMDAAAWSGANLPDGSAVLTRKPRLFYVESGVPSRTFPFTDDPHALLALADSLGVRYVLVDQWDGLAGRYVAEAVRKDLGAFCALRGFQGDGGAGALTLPMLGILPPAERAVSSPSGEARIVRCPPSYLRGDGAAPYSATLSGGAIPLLRGLDP
jgi:4-amino-4-deoxy-L-arabinose transferase-like glycosyltransferase